MENKNYYYLISIGLKITHTRIKSIIFLLSHHYLSTPVIAFSLCIRISVGNEMLSQKATHLLRGVETLNVRMRNFCVHRANRSPFVCYFLFQFVCKAAAERGKHFRDIFNMSRSIFFDFYYLIKLTYLLHARIWGDRLSVAKFQLSQVSPIPVSRKRMAPSASIPRANCWFDHVAFSRWHLAAFCDSLAGNCRFHRLCNWKKENLQLAKWITFSSSWTKFFKHIF